MDVRVRGDKAQITLDLRDLEDILLDLNDMQAQIMYYRSKLDFNGDIEGGTYSIEPGTRDFINALADKGVTCG